ncbi:MAG: thioesterase family protein [Flavobacteriaceae bacterium]|nr:thioesterase family protein [Flavobacteriaceae bacterium]MCY4268393.1 thioesterase family protein [Flavobacteriaceae bacterium]
MKFITKKKTIRYVETDQMGVVHHSNYVLYLEEARIEWLDALNTPYGEMEKNGIISPVVEVNLKYHYPLFFGDLYSVEIQLVKFPKATLELTYHVFNQNNQLICTGYTKLAFLSSETKKPIPIPSHLSSKLVADE